MPDIEYRDPLIGRVLKDSYEVLGKIGEGGMGAVYRAAQQHLGRSVAVKVLPPTLAGQQELVDRFFREARLLSQLSHPHIVGMIDFGVTDDGLVFMVMELLAGISLDSAVGKTGVGLERALDIMTEVCAGVGAAHSVGLIHRDLKPANIFLARVTGETEVVKVLDFGIAKATGDVDQNLTQAGTMMGTPGFIAPEQIDDSSSSDARCDIYALGAILHYLVSGDRPFSGKTPHMVMAKQLDAELEMADLKALGVPAGVEAVIRQAMALSPDERYQTCDQLLDALADVAGTTSDVVRRTRKIQRPTAPPESSTQLPLIPGLGTSAPIEPQPTIAEPGTRDTPSQHPTIPYATQRPAPLPAPTTTGPGPDSTHIAPRTSPPSVGPTTAGASAAPASGPSGGMLALAALIVVVLGVVAVVALRGDRTPANNVTTGGEAGGGPSDAEQSARAAAEQVSQLRDRVELRRQAIATARDDTFAEHEAVERELDEVARPDAAQRARLRAAAGAAALAAGIAELALERDTLWSQATRAVERGRQQLTDGQWAAARVGFDDAGEALRDYERRLPEIEATMRLRAAALGARESWRRAAAQAGIERTVDSGLAEQSLASAQSAAQRGDLDQAKGAFASAESQFKLAASAADERLASMRGEAQQTLVAAQKERAACEKLYDDADALTLPSDAERAAAALDEGRRLLALDQPGAAMVQLEQAREAYAELRAAGQRELDQLGSALARLEQRVDAVRQQIGELTEGGALFDKGVAGVREFEPIAALDEGAAAVARAAAAKQRADYDRARAELSRALDAYDGARKAILARLAANAKAVAIAQSRWEAIRERSGELVAGAASTLVERRQAILERVGAAEKEASRQRALASVYGAATVELRRWTAEALVAVGDAAYFRQDFSAAAAAYRDSLTFKPRNLQGWINLGGSLDQLDKLDESIAAYGKALEIDPKARVACFNRGTVYAQQGAKALEKGDPTVAKQRFAKAAADFERCTELDPKDWQALYRLGQMQGQLEQKQWIRTLLQAHKIAPRAGKQQIETDFPELFGR